MKDLREIDSAAFERHTPVPPGRNSRATHRTGEHTELAASEPIDIYHWAAVALVTALMCAVLGYAAGTPALSRAAHVTSVVFGVMGGALVLGGVVRGLRGLRARFGAHGAVDALGIAQSR
jgi:hypothetical protein